MISFVSETEGWCSYLSFHNRLYEYIHVTTQPYFLQPKRLAETKKMAYTRTSLLIKIVSLSFKTEYILTKKVYNVLLVDTFK